MLVAITAHGNLAFIAKQVGPQSDFTMLVPGVRNVDGIEASGGELLRILEAW